MAYYKLRAVTGKPYTLVDFVCNTEEELLNLGLQSDPLVVSEAGLPQYKYGICLKKVETGDIIDTSQVEIDAAIAEQTDFRNDASNPNFLGTYTSIESLQIAHPTPNKESYAYVDAGIENDIEQYIWDNDDAKWVIGASGGGCGCNIVNDLTSTHIGAALDHNQGKVLKAEINAINALLQTDDVNLDTLQEIKDAIIALQNGGSLNISNISGLQSALDAKVDEATLLAAIDSAVGYAGWKNNDNIYADEVDLREGLTLSWPSPCDQTITALEVIIPSSGTQPQVSIEADSTPYTIGTSGEIGQNDLISVTADIPCFLRITYLKS